MIDILSAFRKRNARRLRKLNDEVLMSAATDFNIVYFNLAVYSYVLSKIVSKPRFLRRENDQTLDGIARVLEKLIRQYNSFANENDILTTFSELAEMIETLEEHDQRFITDLVTKGKLKMGVTLYAQGMSLGVASELTGMEKQEILNYAGETMMFDRFRDQVSILDRMKMARKLLE